MGWCATWTRATASSRTTSSASRFDRRRHHATQDRLEQLSEDRASALIDDDGAGEGQRRPEFAGLAPILIPEIAEVDEEEKENNDRESAPDLPVQLLSMIKVKVKKLEKCDEVWRSAGIATKLKASIWEDKIGSGKLVGGRNRARVNLGFFASGSFAAPQGDRYTLELTDLTINAVQQSKWMPHAIRQVLVHPSRFHRVWGIQTGTQHLFVWEPIPPSEHFVALGMVATNSEDPPPVRTVHCVPREWVEPAPDMTKMIWSDAGASGKAGSLWAVGSLQLLAASHGTVSPSKFSWRLRSPRFTLSESLRQTIASGAIRVTQAAFDGQPQPQRDTSVEE